MLAPAVRPVSKPVAVPAGGHNYSGLRPVSQPVPTASQAYDSQLYDSQAYDSQAYDSQARIRIRGDAA